jgi:hypothetical protein
MLDPLELFWVCLASNQSMRIAEAEADIAKRLRTILVGPFGAIWRLLKLPIMVKFISGGSCHVNERRK